MRINQINGIRIVNPPLIIVIAAFPHDKRYCSCETKKIVPVRKINPNKIFNIFFIVCYVSCILKRFSWWEEKKIVELKFKIDMINYPFHHKGARTSFRGR